MGKFINTKWKVVVGTTDLSDHAFNVEIADEKDQIDVSGFSPTGTREYLPGLQTQGVTVSFLGDFGTNSVFQTLQPIYDAGTTAKFFVQPDDTAGTSAANPIYGGTASVYSLPVAGQLNERGEMVVEFRPAPASKFTWGTTAP